MLDENTKNVISEDTTEQLNKRLEGLVEATSFWSAQGMGIDQTLNEMIAEIVVETNTRKNRR